MFVGTVLATPLLVPEPALPHLHTPNHAIPPPLILRLQLRVIGLNEGLNFLSHGQ